MSLNFDTSIGYIFRGENFSKLFFATHPSLLSMISDETASRLQTCLFFSKQMGELGAVGIFICFVKIVTVVSEKIY